MCIWKDSPLQVQQCDCMPANVTCCHNIFYIILCASLNCFQFHITTVQICKNTSIQCLFARRCTPMQFQIQLKKQNHNKNAEKEIRKNDLNWHRKLKSKKLHAYSKPGARYVLISYVWLVGNASDFSVCIKFYAFFINNHNFAYSQSIHKNHMHITTCICGSKL